jgi:hypothetical protein
LGVTQRFFLAPDFSGPAFPGRWKKISGHFAMAKRGRPTKEPSAEDRAKVKELLADKAPITDLAKLFGYSADLPEIFFRRDFYRKK